MARHSSPHRAIHVAPDRNLVDIGSPVQYFMRAPLLSRQGSCLSHLGRDAQYRVPIDSLPVAR